MDTQLTRSVEELMALAKESPRVAIIEPLLYAGDILLIHAPEESFKSIFVCNLAVSVAKGGRFLRTWEVPDRFTVGVVNTELHEVALGERLQRMAVNQKS
jgi:hypothetical protein